MRVPARKNDELMPSYPEDDMKPSPDSLKQAALGALLKYTQQYAPRANQLRAVAHTPAQAAPGEIWLTQTNEGANGEPEEPLTVLLIERFEGEAGEPTIFTSAPIFSNPRMAGPSDAVLPREILGFEAGIALASCSSNFAESLVTCEGALPADWTSRLAAFYQYVRGIAEGLPPGVTTGAPYIDENDPAFVFHEELTEQMHALSGQVLEWVTTAESSEVPGWFSTAFESLKERAGALAESANEWWEACAFPITLPRAGFGMSSLGAGHSIPGWVGLIGMAAQGLMSGAARHFWRLTVGDTGAIVLLEECRTPTGAFALEVLADPNNRIEGSDVLDAAGHVVATIAGGKSGAPFRLEDNRLLLRLSDGRIVPLSEITKANE